MSETHSSYAVAHHRPIWWCALLLLPLALGTAHAQTVAEAIDCAETVPMLDLGALPAVFVPNQGQWPEAVAYGTAGLGASTVTVGDDGITFALGDTTVTQAFVDAEAGFRGGTASPANVSFLRAERPYEGLAAYASLEVTGLSTGVDLSLSATGRRLLQTLRLASADAANAVAWRYTGAEGITISPNGHVTISLGDHTLALRAPRAWVGDDRQEVAAFIVIEDDVLHLQLGDVPVEGTVTVETEVLHTAHSDAYDARRVGGRVLAVTAAATPGGDRDTVVAALDAETDLPQWLTIIGGSGDDIGTSLALTATGDLAVAGTTNSTDLPGIERVAGGRDGFVLRLDPEGRRVLGGVTIGAQGDDHALAVGVDVDGQVVVAGTASEDLRASGETGRFASLFPTRDPASRRYFVSRLTPELEPVGTSVIDAAPVSRLRIWRDCDDLIVIGPPTVTSAGTCTGWPDLEYTMDHYTEDYDADHDFNSPDPGLGVPPGGWGYHALRWRQYHADSVDPPPPYTIDWNLAPVATPIPKSGLPACGDDDDLDTLETLIFDRGSVITDPPGGWACSTHSTPQQLALFAAFYSQRYGSAAYTTFREFNFLQNAWNTYPVAIEKTTWEVNCPAGNSSYTGQGLEDLCDFTSGWYGGINCSAGNAGVMGGTNVDPFYLRASIFEISFWKVFVWFIRGIPVETDFDFWHEDFYQAGDYIVDPPDDPDEAREIAEAVAQLGSALTDRLPMRLDHHDGGQTTTVAEGHALVRAIALDP